MRGEETHQRKHPGRWNIKRTEDRVSCLYAERVEEKGNCRVEGGEPRQDKTSSKSPSHAAGPCRRPPCLSCRSEGTKRDERQKGPTPLLRQRTCFDGRAKEGREGREEGSASSPCFFLPSSALLEAQSRPPSRLSCSKRGPRVFYKALNTFLNCSHHSCAGSNVERAERSLLSRRHHRRSSRRTRTRSSSLSLSHGFFAHSSLPRASPRDQKAKIPDEQQKEKGKGRGSSREGQTASRGRSTARGTTGGRRRGEQREKDGGWRSKVSFQSIYALA